MVIGVIKWDIRGGDSIAVLFMDGDVILDGVIADGDIIIGRYRKSLKGLFFVV